MDELLKEIGKLVAQFAGKNGWASLYISQRDEQDIWIALHDYRSGSRIRTITGAKDVATALEGSDE